MEWLVLIVGGVGLVFTDFFIPTFGALSLTGLGLLVWAQFRAFGVSTVSGVGSVAFTAAALAAAAWAGYKLARRTSLIHTSAISGEDDPHESLVGAEGVVATALRPSGKVTIDGLPYDALCDADMIDPETRVRVVAVRAGRLIVRRV